MTSDKCHIDIALKIFFVHKKKNNSQTPNIKIESGLTFLLGRNYEYIQEKLIRVKSKLDPSTPLWPCDFCGRPCAPLARLDFLRTRVPIKKAA